MDYKHKYLKYKQKYLELKNQSNKILEGGAKALIINEVDNGLLYQNIGTYFFDIYLKKKCPIHLNSNKFKTVNCDNLIFSDNYPENLDDVRNYYEIFLNENMIDHIELIDGSNFIITPNQLDNNGSISANLNYINYRQEHKHHYATLLNRMRMVNFFPKGSNKRLLFIIFIKNKIDMILSNFNYFINYMVDIFPNSVFHFIIIDVPLGLRVKNQIDDYIIIHIYNRLIGLKRTVIYSNDNYTNLHINIPPTYTYKIEQYILENKSKTLTKNFEFIYSHDQTNPIIPRSPIAENILKYMTLDYMFPLCAPPESIVWNGLMVAKRAEPLDLDSDSFKGSFKNITLEARAVAGAPVAGAPVAPAPASAPVVAAPPIVNTLEQIFQNGPNLDIDGLHLKIFSEPHIRLNSEMPYYIDDLRNIYVGDSLKRFYLIARETDLERKYYLKLKDDNTIEISKVTPIYLIVKEAEAESTVTNDPSGPPILFNAK